ncbi:hypothetical protein LINPERHAP2_LOCUS42229, partial [Linum perenne]
KPYPQGKFQAKWFKALETMLHAKVENWQLLSVPHSHPKESGLTITCYLIGMISRSYLGWRKPSMHTLFNWAMQQVKVMARPDVSNYMEEDNVEQVDSYTILMNTDHHAIMKDMINQGINMHATRLKDAES